MPRIVLKQPGQAVADFSVSGSTVIVAGIAVDCAARQSDVTEIVEVRQDGGQAQIGGEGAYLAHIEIPPRTYREVATTEQGEQPEGAQNTEPAAEPLDPNAILITLWPIA